MRLPTCFALALAAVCGCATTPTPKPQAGNLLLSYPDPREASPTCSPNRPCASAARCCPNQDSTATNLPVSAWGQPVTSDKAPADWFQVYMSGGLSRRGFMPSSYEFDIVEGHRSVGELVCPPKAGLTFTTLNEHQHMGIVDWDQCRKK